MFLSTLGKYRDRVGCSVCSKPELSKFYWYNLRMISRCFATGRHTAPRPKTMRFERQTIEVQNNVQYFKRRRKTQEFRSHGLTLGQEPRASLDRMIYTDGSVTLIRRGRVGILRLCGGAGALWFTNNSREEKSAFYCALKYLLHEHRTGPAPIRHRNYVITNSIQNIKHFRDKSIKVRCEMHLAATESSYHDVQSSYDNSISCGWFSPEAVGNSTAGKRQGNIRAPPVKS